MPALSITRDELLAFNPCGGADRLALFGRRKSLTAAQALKAGASVRDVLWVVGRMGRKDLCVRFALAAAQRVAHLDRTGTAQPCLDAAGAYVADPSEPNLTTLRNVRSAAAYAAAAAAAAYAAARKEEIEAQKALLIEVLS